MEWVITEYILENLQINQLKMNNPLNGPKIFK